MRWIIAIVAIFTLTLVPTIGATQTCGNGEATSFQWPLDTWNPGCNGYWSTCNGDHHLGTDATPDGEAIGTPVYSSCTGVVKQAQAHSGYGGTVIIECWTGDECVSVLYGHMFANTTQVNDQTYLGLQVSAGQEVQRGQLIGYLADREHNGDWRPHVHFGIHKGAYSNLPVFSCDGKWTFAGYTTRSCIFDDWYDAEEFVPAHMAKPDYDYDGNAVSCRGPISGGASTNWYYTCENEHGVFYAGETVYTMLRLSNVITDHKYRVVAWKDGVEQWSWQTDWNRVGNGWKYSHFWPALYNSTSGYWEMQLFVKTEQDFEYLDTVSFTVQPYTYDNNIYSCSGPVTGGWETNWVYSCHDRRAIFQAGEDVYALFRLDHVGTDHRFRVYTYKDGFYQWSWTSSWNRVDSVWDHAYFWPIQREADSGEWTFYVAVDTGNGFSLVDAVSFWVQ